MPSWIRNIPETWCNGKGWRTDIPLTVLGSMFYNEARFSLEDGTVVTVPMDDMRRALKAAPVRAQGLIVGPYNVDPVRHRIFDISVAMTVTLREHKL